MKKVLFVDEKMYRFSHYYESKSWWRKNGIDAVYKSYEQKSSKYKIYSSLVFNRPDYIVLVQLSTKNQVLMQIASLLRIKVIFWQHGIFDYPVPVKSILKHLPMKLEQLLALSAHDIKHISSIFTKVDNSEVIQHYDLAKIKPYDPMIREGKLSIAYLGQIVTAEQVYGSGARIMEKYLGDFDLFGELVAEIDDKKLPIVIYAKQHPGDKSEYLKELARKHQCIFLADNNEIFNCQVAISYYSTLMLAFMELNRPVFQFPMTNQDFRIDMNHYDKHGNLTCIDSVKGFLDSLDTIKSKHCQLTDVGTFQTISQTLVKVILSE